MSESHEFVTAWSGRKRHLAAVGNAYTLCQTTEAVRAGGDYVGMYRRPMTQELIEALPPCQLCARAAAKGDES